AWKTALDPATASQYAFILYPIRNAEGYNTGQLPRDAVGVHALDERTLEVELEQPIAYFDKLVAFPTYFPVQQRFYEATAGRYGADAGEMLYTGPFALSNWVHSSSLRMEKNPYYWDSERIQLNAINAGYITSDSNTLLNLYKDGQIVMVDLTAEMLEGAMQQRWQLERFMDGGVFYIDFNHRPERLTSNLNLRKALSLAQDSSELVNEVIKLPGYQPALSIIPSWMQGVEQTFHAEHPPQSYPYDVALAREYLEKAKQELGLQTLPPLVLLTDTSPVATISAQYYQQVFRRNLGLEIVIDAQVFGQRIAKMNAGDFDLILNGWGPDYNDPLTFADLYASWNLNNRGHYRSAEVDALIRTAQTSLDQQVRMEAFAEAQQIIHEDAAFIGNYERGRVYATDPRVKGILRRVFGAESDFTNAGIETGTEKRRGQHNVAIPSPAAPAGRHHRLVHCHRHFRCHAQRAGRSAVGPARHDRGDTGQPRSALWPRPTRHRAILHLHGQPAAGRLRHLLHPAEPSGQRHHPRALPGFSHAGRVGDYVRSFRWSAVGSAHRAVSQPAAGHHHHVP